MPYAHQSGAETFQNAALRLWQVAHIVAEGRRHGRCSSFVVPTAEIYGHLVCGFRALRLLLRHCRIPHKQRATIATFYQLATSSTGLSADSGSATQTSLTGVRNGARERRGHSVYFLRGLAASD